MIHTLLGVFPLGFEYNAIIINSPNILWPRTMFRGTY